MGIQSLLILVLAAALGTADAPTRKWTDAAGRFSVEAEMVDLQNGAVHLKRTDGKIISVPLKELSLADQEFVRQATGSSSRTTQDEAAADKGIIRLPLYPHVFQRTVWIDAMDSGGTARATVSLGDGSRPSGPLASSAIPPLTEGYYLGLVGLPASPDPIVKLAKGAFAAEGLRVGCVEVVTVHEGGKLTVRVASDIAAQFKKDECLLLLRPARCSTAQLRSIAEFVPVADERASSLGLGC